MEYQPRLQFVYVARSANVHVAWRSINPGWDAWEKNKWYNNLERCSRSQAQNHLTVPQTWRLHPWAKVLTTSSQVTCCQQGNVQFAEIDQQLQHMSWVWHLEPACGKSSPNWWEMRISESAGAKITKVSLQGGQGGKKCCTSICMVQYILRMNYTTLHRAEQHRKRARERARKRADFTANPFVFTQTFNML